MAKGYTEETIEKYKAKLIVYLKKNPTATWKQVMRDTKIKPERVFEGGLREAFKKANVPLSGYYLRRNRDEQVRDVLEFIKSNPGCTISEIQEVTGVTIPRVWGQIKKAYEMAGEEYPKRNLPTSANSAIRKRAYAFENEILQILKRQGEVIKYYKTRKGVADGLLKIGPKKYVIEIKDYQSRNNITLSEIKQLHRYIEGVENCCDGVLITHDMSKGKRRKLYIDGNEIRIITREEIYQGDVV